MPNALDLCLIYIGFMSGCVRDLYDDGMICKWLEV